MNTNQPLHILCISSFFKGERFLSQAHALGHKVYLVTARATQEEAWPWEAIEEVFYMDEEDRGKWIMPHLISGIAFQMQKTHFDMVIALDDFDVEKAAHVREHFRIPGMGETTVRYFRDKLAMRMKAKDAGIPVPEFVPLFNDAEIHAYTERVSPPWMIKPRFAASATGIKKVHSTQELWFELDQMSNTRHQFLLEKFAPGKVYHVDTLNFDHEVVFSRASQYLDTPFEVAHGGGIFRSATMEVGNESEQQLFALNQDLMKAFGMKSGASHSEYIQDNETGTFYFLETSYRVGGANLAEMVEAASGISLWEEWAKIEIASCLKAPYTLPGVRTDYAGIVVSLSRFKHPDTRPFQDEEIVWRMDKDWHIGLIVSSEDQSRILELLEGYTHRIATEYHASIPAPDKPTIY